MTTSVLASLLHKQRMRNGFLVKCYQAQSTDLFHSADLSHFIKASNLSRAFSMSQTCQPRSFYHSVATDPYPYSPLSGSSSAYRPKATPRIALIWLCLDSERSQRDLLQNEQIGSQIGGIPQDSLFVQEYFHACLGKVRRPQEWNFYLKLHHCTASFGGLLRQNWLNRFNWCSQLYLFFLALR